MCIITSYSKNIIYCLQTFKYFQRKLQFLFADGVLESNNPGKNYSCNKVFSFKYYLFSNFSYRSFRRNNSYFHSSYYDRTLRLVYFFQSCKVGRQSRSQGMRPWWTSSFLVTFNFTNWKRQGNKKKEKYPKFTVRLSVSMRLL